MAPKSSCKSTNLSPPLSFSCIVTETRQKSTTTSLTYLHSTWVLISSQHHKFQSFRFPYPQAHHGANNSLPTQHNKTNHKSTHEPRPFEKRRYLGTIPVSFLVQFFLWGDCILITGHRCFSIICYSCKSTFFPK